MAGRDASWIESHSDLSDTHRPSALLSELSVLFIEAAAYARITKQEALDAVCYVLSENSSSSLLVRSLLDSFIHHRLLTTSDDHFDMIATSIHGIFTPLTMCYSSRCDGRRQGCYSPTCPHKTLNGKLRLWDTDGGGKPVVNWIEHVSQQVHSSLSTQEMKRQAAIAELLDSEQQYSYDFDILHDIYAQPLLQSSCIEELRRKKLHDLVFCNYETMARLHRRVCNDLVTYHETNGLFGLVGTTLLKHVARLETPYIIYAAAHVKAMSILSAEIHRNPAFHRFLECQNANENHRKLGLRHFLTMPVHRIGRLRLLISAILKYTIHDGDHLALSATIESLNDLQHRMNEATRKAQVETRLLQIASSLIIPPHLSVTLRQLLPNHACLLHEGDLPLSRSSSHSLTTIRCHIFLFSHALLITRLHRSPDGYEEFTLLSRPIPLAMLYVVTTRSFIRRLSSRVAQPGLLLSSIRRRSSSGQYSETSSLSTGTITGLHIRARILCHLRHSLRRNRQTSPAPAESPESPLKPPSPPPTPSQSRMLKIGHLAFPDCSFRFICSNAEERETWRELIQQAIPTGPFQLHALCDVPTSSVQPVVVNGSLMFPTGCGRICCTLAFDGPDGQPMMALGTQSGLWVGPKDGTAPFYLVEHQHCLQLALVDNNIVIVFGRHPKRCLTAYATSELYPSTPTVNGHVIKASGILCFAVGSICHQSVLCYLKRRRRTKQIVLVLLVPKPFHGTAFEKRKEIRLRVREPCSVQIAYDTIYVQSKTEGIEHVDVFSSQTTMISCDTGVDFVPLAHGGIICSELAAWSLEGSSRIEFQSRAQSMAISYPYLVVFSSSVIEIWHVRTFELVQAIGGHHIRCVYISSVDDSTPLPYPKLWTKIHATMLQAENRVTRVYELCLGSK
ncbi:RHO1 GDP-GTP exchange protein 2 [Apophysomyces ossiformis]|uniref:RHO1 GDP-GTP exchange protein 2 n=1 Tax=Apophysomyces ossiformis TaxID=679940 RepID=A0A8H7BYM5_9FUNG|nr:RHO1 GDP-GTP exchange protein 2 [Apophysomyces ossiformis]